MTGTRSAPGSEGGGSSGSATTLPQTSSANSDTQASVNETASGVVAVNLHPHLASLIVATVHTATWSVSNQSWEVLSVEGVPIGAPDSVGWMVAVPGSKPPSTR